MKTQSTDTRPEAEDILITLLKKASVAKKFSRVRSLSETTLKLSRRAIARANQNLSEEQIDILFVAHHYGNQIAQNLKKYLADN